MRFPSIAHLIRYMGPIAVLLISAVTVFPESHDDGTSSGSGLYLAAGGGLAASGVVGFVGRGDVGYRFGDVRVAVQGSYTSIARGSMIGIMATGWYDIPSGSTFIPYVGGGLGLVILSSSSFLSATGTILGVQAGVGVNIPLSGALDLQVGYRIMAPFGNPLLLFHHAELGVVYRL